MSGRRIDVVSEAEPRTIHVDGAEAESSIAEILRIRGLPLNTRCGQRGLCEGCLIVVLRGSVRDLRSNVVIDAGHSAVRACDHTAVGDITIRIPRRSIASNAPSVLEDYAVRIPWALDPVTDARWGVAVDLGTTTVALALVDLASGRVVTRASAFNAQTHLGDDVVTRITLCMNSPSTLREMQKAVLEQTIAPLLRQAMNAGGAALPGLGAIVVAGNATMLHLLVGEDPSSMGVAPFMPRFTQHRIFRAGDLLAEWDGAFPDAEVHLLPSAAAYIGADITAGIISTGLAYEEGPSLLVDVGTNGEIVLAREGRLIACATAAGPAFEGVRLASGMRAGDGAITRIRLDVPNGAHEFDWIGRKRRIKPAGLCGSAYIDFLAEARRSGLISPSGRFNRDSARPVDWHTETSGLLGYRLLRGQGGRPVIVSECDVAALLAAKAAIAAGVQTLLAQSDLCASDIRNVYLAGGFGTHMSAGNAIAIGMLPGFVDSQILPVGNSSLAGAFLALADRSLLDEMCDIAPRVRAIELNLCNGFADAYIDNLCLP